MFQIHRKFRNSIISAFQRNIFTRHVKVIFLCKISHETLQRTPVSSLGCVTENCNIIVGRTCSLISTLKINSKANIIQCRVITTETSLCDWDLGIPRRSTINESSNSRFAGRFLKTRWLLHRYPSCNATA